MRNLIIIFLSIGFAFGGCISSSASTPTSTRHSGSSSGAEIVDGLRLQIELDTSSKPVRAFVRFENHSQRPLWFPNVETPDNWPDRKRKSLWIWVGFFESDPGSQFRLHYVVPHMKKVPPSGECRFELTEEDLVQELSRRELVPKLKARVATKAFVYTNVRGEQPLDDYIKNSIVVESSIVVTK